MANLCKKLFLNSHSMKKFYFRTLSGRPFSNFGSEVNSKSISVLNRANSEPLNRLRKFDFMQVQIHRPLSSQFTNAKASRPNRKEKMEEKLWSSLNKYDRIPKDKKLSLETHFTNDLSLSDSDHGKLIEALEDDFDIEIPDSDAEKLMTPKDMLDYLGEKYVNYKEKSMELEDKYRRQLAETENVRQRFLRQVEEAKAFGNQNFCKDLLEIADILELATESVPKDALAKGDNAVLKQLYDGLVMTQQKLTKIFEKHGLVAVRPLGEKFNPNIHEAVFQIKDATKEAGSVANVVKIGYLLHDRLIRPAKVGVYISS